MFLKALNKLTVNGLVVELWVNISNISRSNLLRKDCYNSFINKSKSLKLFI